MRLAAPNPDNLIRLFDGNNRLITEMHPDFGERLREFGYNDVAERRGRPKNISQSGSENWTRHRDRIKAIADARELAQLDWIGGVLSRIVLYACGKIRCKSQTGEPQIDMAYDEYFYGWCGDERNDDGTTRCDISGRHRFSKLVQMALLAFFVDGDCGFLEIAPQESPTGEFCLQAIEADRIGSPFESDTSEDYIGGFKIDINTGRILFVRIYRLKRSGTYEKIAEVPYENFIHVCDPDRSDEYRGMSKLVRLLNDMRDIRETIESEKQSIKVQSQYAAMIGTKDPFNSTGPMAWTGRTPEGTPTMDALYGKIMKMAEGENFSMLAPAARPSGAFINFMQILIRKMAVSLGFSYGFLWDLATLGGASQRIEIQSDLRRIQYLQENVLVNRILNRVRAKVISQGISMKMLPPHPAWKRATWGFGPFITADLGHEMEADIQAVGMGLTKIEDITEKYGDTPMDIFMANAKTGNEAGMVAGQFGLPVETFARGMFPNFTAEKAAFMTPTPQPPPPPLSIQSLGDKGLGPLIDIMEKVGDGTIDRDSAIEAIIQIYQIPRSEAEKIVPEEPTETDKNRVAGLDVHGEHPKPSPNGSNGSTKKLEAMENRVVELSAKLEEANRRDPSINITVPERNIEAPIVNLSVPEQMPPVVRFEQAAPTVNVSAPVVNIPAPIVNFQAPDATPPVINVQPSKVTVRAPVVHVAQPRIQVKPPDVKVNVRPTPITLHVPKATSEEQTVTRDKDGNVTGSKTKINYKDDK